MAFTVRGRTVLITGAGMGMGKLYAERAVREGAAAVVLWLGLVFGVQWLANRRTRR